MGSGMLDTLLAEREREVILKALEQYGQDRTAAARVLGVSRPRLYRRMKALGIPVKKEKR